MDSVETTAGVAVYKADFQRERLIQARIALMLTQTKLAKLIGKTPQSISQYESGNTVPSDSVIGLLAKNLNVSKSFFFKPVKTRPEPQPPVFFRSYSAATKRAREAAEIKLQWIDECVSCFEAAYDNLPIFELPKLRLPADPGEITDSEIESAAEKVRDHWGLGCEPIGNMISTLEKNGVFVFRLSLGSEKLDALSVHQNRSHPYIIINSDRNSSCRCRFDAAHELGHIVLHSKIREKDLNDADLRKLIERQAHLFAASFLMPRIALLPDGSKRQRGLGGYREMKAKWGLSIAAIIYREKQLGLIDEDEYRRLYVGLSRRGWRNTEPLDDVLPIERPSLARRCYLSLNSTFSLSSDEFRSETMLPDYFYSELLGAL